MSNVTQNSKHSNPSILGWNDINLSQQIEPSRSSEEALLLACASTACGGENAAVIRQLAGECQDWPYFLKTARNNRILSLVTSVLDPAAADRVPLGHLELIRQHFRENGARNLFLTQELLVLIRKFDEQGIAVIPLKGPLLAATAFGNVALREFGDLDVLVTRRDFPRAVQLLNQLGYHLFPDQLDERGSTLVESQLGFDFFRADGRVHVELHWSFIQTWLGFNVDLEALWKTPACVRVGGTTVLNLPAETLLLYLCAHGTKHRWERLCWVADVAQVLRTQLGLDWDQLLNTAARTGSRRTLFLGLHLAHTLLGARLPAKVLTPMNRDATATAMARRISADLFSPVPGEDLNSARWSNDWFYLRSKERWQDRFHYLGYWAGWLLQPSEKDRQWIHLSARFGWLYIFLRPMRVLCTFLRPRSPSEFPKTKSL